MKRFKLFIGHSPYFDLDFEFKLLAVMKTRQQYFRKMLCFFRLHCGGGTLLSKMLAHSLHNKASCRKCLLESFSIVLITL